MEEIRRGQGGPRRAGWSGAIYQAAVQDELRVAAEETDGDRETVRKAIASRAAEIKVRDGREDDAGGLIDGAVDAAADRVSSESPAMRLAATRISETGEALNRAAVGLKTVPQPSGTTAFDAARAAFDEAVMNEFNVALEETAPAGGRGPSAQEQAGDALALSHPDLAGNGYFQHLIRDKAPAYTRISADMGKLPDTAPDWLKHAFEKGDQPTVALAVTLGVDGEQPANEAETALAEEDPLAFIVLKYTHASIELPAAGPDAPQPTRADYLQFGRDAAKNAIATLDGTGRDQYLSSLLANLDDVRADYVSSTVGALLSTELPEASAEKIIAANLEVEEYGNPDWRPGTQAGKAMALISVNMASALGPEGRQSIWDGIGGPVATYITAQRDFIASHYRDDMNYAAMIGEWLKQMSQSAPSPAADLLVDLVTDLDPGLIAQMGGGRLEDGVKILGDHATAAGVDRLARWLTTPRAEDAAGLNLQNVTLVNKDGTGAALGDAILRQLQANGEDDYAVADLRGGYDKTLKDATDLRAGARIGSSLNCSRKTATRSFSRFLTA